MKKNNLKLKFSFIIINYNSFAYTTGCLSSIKKFCRSYPYEIIVIDNASSDDSIARLEKNFKDVLFIKNIQNYGFARACNQGIDRSSGDFLIFLNNDFEFTTDIFDRILDKFNRYENLGLLGFQLLNSDKTPQRTGFIFPSILRRILQLTIVPILRKRKSILVTIPNEKDQVVDYIKGALMILPSKLLNELNLGFDENYFMYHEEMDLAYQLRKHGKICLLDSTAAGIHYGMHFEEVTDERIFLWRNKNLLYFYKKNYGKLNLWTLVLVNIIFFSIKWLFSFSNTDQRCIYKKVIQFSLEYL
ncbi:MAG: glycosyltransferase family 2 protein [bacterium]|nr:MAG: glycosyltransferase family 2 protein [bacterium]